MLFRSGLGRRLLAELERHASAAGVHTLRLDTNRALSEAIGLYRAAGYEENAFEDCQDLRAFRTRMRERSLAPPALPDDLAFVDQPDADSQPEDGLL